MIRGVIFDLDGVLVTTDELHYQSWKRVTDAEGIYFDRTINERLRGVDRTTSLGIILERAQRPYDDAERRRFMERKNDLFREMVAALSPADLLPGVMPLLTALQQRGIEMAVASSSKNARLIVEKLGLSPCFAAVVDGNDITRSKPDPEVFVTAAARLNLPPNECLVVEDALSGIDAAHRAGMPVLGVSPSTANANATRWVHNLAGISVDDVLAIGR